MMWFSCCCFGTINSRAPHQNKTYIENHHEFSCQKLHFRFNLLFECYCPHGPNCEFNSITEKNASFPRRFAPQLKSFEEYSTLFPSVLCHKTAIFPKGNATYAD